MAKSGLQFPPPCSVLQLGYAPGVYQQSILGPPPCPAPAPTFERPQSARRRARHEIWNSPYAQYLLDTPTQGQPRVPHRTYHRPPKNNQFQLEKRMRQQRSREQEFKGQRRFTRGHHKIDPLLWKPAVPKIETSDQIEKWRQDRRRNYPTAENVRHKIEGEMKRHTMGAVAQALDLKRGRRHKQWNQRRQHCTNSAFVTQAISNQESTSKRVSTEQVNVDAAHQQCTASALQALAGYGSNSDSEEVTSDLANERKASSVICAVTTDKVEKPSLQDIQQPPQRQKQVNQFGRAKNLKCRKKGRKSDSVQEIGRFRRPSLLQKLLAREIQQERNILLQCIRYIVRNDFFRT
ncbi:FMR1-interacting protein NUFIP1-like isoform X2 [Corticium candelabrum]|uniref:FMR1-interacting protein NUFIP1-like isoform X2 n=1 Tax=Corticium candelabrum TaxID=121492 RepID=UPI002E25CF0E|nr:FMR1-interacting protein NUFIP1-like isoform X2 [Corticium candelabrum]